MSQPRKRISLRWRSLIASGALAGATAFLPSGIHGQDVDPAFAAGAQVVVDSIIVQGNLLFSEGVLRGTIGLPPGTSITYVDVQAAERRLWQTGAFRDIQVTVREGDTPLQATLTFWVEEHPVVRSYSIEGLTGVSERDVWEHADIRAREAYSPNRVTRARVFIVTSLAERGVPFARVEERIEPVPGIPGEVDVTLEVFAGQRVAIADVLFRGNEIFRDSELRGVMATRREGFWWFRTGSFLPETLELDLYQALPDFYASHGFVDFRVLGDTLIIDPESGKARLEIDVFEGEQYVVESFDVDGNRRFAVQDLERYFQPEAGGILRTLGLRGGQQDGESGWVFDQPGFLQAGRRVEELYRNEGYLYMRLVPDLERLPPAEEGGSPRVALRWNIQEGQPAYIRRVHIEGNDFTHDRVIRERILLLPGDVYSEERLIRSYQAISGLGFFSTPVAFPEINPDEVTGDIDVVFRVDEQQTGSINFGTTMGGQTGISGFIGYDQPNLFGQAKVGSLRWDFGRYQNNFSVRYSDPALFESRVSGTVSLFDSRDRFFSFATGDRKWRGVTTRFGFPVPGSFFARLFLGYSLTRTEYRLRGGVDDTSLFGRPSGIQSQASVGIARTTTDHPLFPSIGTDLSWMAEVNGGILGGDGNYTKHRIEGTWWVPVGTVGGTQPGSRPIVFTLGLKARMGTIFGDAEAFPFDRFWMGGVQFGERLRGYDETSITPRGYFDRGSGQVRDVERLGDTFLKVGAEYAVRLSDMISVAAFYEAGNLWNHPREIDPSRLFRGAGFGVEMMTPFGPIGLDYAYGFDRANPGWELHFRMGGDQGIF